MGILSEIKPPFRPIDRPAEDEYSPSSSQYIALVPEDRPVLQQLKENAETIIKLFHSLPAEKLEYRYAAGKWSLKEVLVHLADDERIYAYRALRFARNDPHQLPGFDQDAFTRYAEAGERPLASILDEYEAVRYATLALYQGFPAAALTRIGRTSEFKCSVRGLLYHITGHELNHLRIIREKYL
jgi:uncharacterized damage-inducible protein DinB